MSYWSFRRSFTTWFGYICCYEIPYITGNESSLCIDPDCCLFKLRKLDMFRFWSFERVESFRFTSKDRKFVSSSYSSYLTIFLFEELFGYFICRAFVKNFSSLLTFFFIFFSFPSYTSSFFIFYAVANLPFGSLFLL